MAHNEHRHNTMTILETTFQYNDTTYKGIIDYKIGVISFVNIVTVFVVVKKRSHNLDKVQQLQQGLP